MKPEVEDATFPDRRRQALPRPPNATGHADQASQAVHREVDHGSRHVHEASAGGLGLPLEVYPDPEMVFAIRKP